MTKQEKIKKSIVDQLYWDTRVDASDIKVDVDGTKVKLDGTVPNYTAKQAAVLDSWTVDGVTKVESNLSIDMSSIIKLPSDVKIKTWIHNSLAFNSSIDSKEIETSVSDGFVELEGTVDTYWKKLQAQRIASETTGVIGVKNKLAVVPTENYFDKEIAKDIEDAIDRRYDVTPNDIAVRVRDGKVKLTGTVPDWRSYTAIIQAAEHTAGVIDVDESLAIKQ